MIFMKIRKFLLIFIGALLVLCFYVSISYAFYTGNISVSKNTKIFSTASGDYVLIDQTALTISGDKAVPISDAKALSSSQYLNQFQIRNDSTSPKVFGIYIVPLSSSNMNYTAIKYAIYDSNASKPTSGSSFGTQYSLATAESNLISDKGFTPGTKKYLIKSVTIEPNTTKTYNLYMWINYNETGTDNITMNKEFKGVLLLGSDVTYQSQLLNTSFSSTSSYKSLFNLVQEQGLNTTNVDSIYFVNMNNKTPAANSTFATFMGSDDTMINSWVEGNNLFFGSYGSVYPGPSMAGAFYNLQNLKTINLSDINTSFVNNMSGMFYYTGTNNNNFTINLGKGFNTKNVTNMHRMFAQTGQKSSAFTLKLGSYFNTYKVTDMSYMFSYTGQNSGNFNLNLGGNFNTYRVKNMRSMFDGTGMFSNKFYLNIGTKFKTANVTDMYAMFYGIGTRNTWTLNLTSFDFTNVGNYTSFFSNRSNSYILTVLANSTNADFINARVNGLVGFNVVQN